MKKLFCIFGILSFILIGAFFIKKHHDNMPYKYPDGKLEYDFSRQSQPRASKILYEYISEDLKKYSTEAKKSANIKLKDIVAFEVDLNDDGVNEIVGFCSSSAFWGTAGYQLFILQKQNKEYKDLSYILNFEPQLKFYVLPDKTNEYKDIILYGSSAFNFKLMTVQYDGQFYRSYIKN